MIVKPFCSLYLVNSIFSRQKAACGKAPLTCPAQCTLKSGSALEKIDLAALDIILGPRNHQLFLFGQFLQHCGAMPQLIH